MDAVAVGDVTIAGTPGNDVTFADQQNYDGTTTIGSGATLRLGTGSPGQDSWLITGTEGAKIVDDGTLVASNAEKDIELSRISGVGSFEQAGPATVTLTGDTAYTGPTTVSGGVLDLAGGTLESSASVQLSKPGATLDVTAAGDQTVNNLSGVGRSMLRLGGDTMTVVSSEDTTYAGGVEGAGGLVKSGARTLTYSGKSAAKGPWAVTQGTLSLARAELGGDLVVDSALRVTGKAAVGGDLTLRKESTLQAGTGAGLAVAGDVALGGATLKVRQKDGVPLPREIPVVTSGGEVTGTFKGLDEGARLDVGGTAYEISYADGRVMLSTPAPAAAPSAETAPAGVGSSAPQSSSSPAVVAALVSLATLGLGALVFFVLRRRRGIAAPRHVRRGAAGPAEGGTTTTAGASQP